MCTLGNPAHAFLLGYTHQTNKSSDWCNIYLIKAPGSNRHRIQNIVFTLW